MRRQRKRSFKLLALMAGFMLFALAACGDDSDDDEAPDDAAEDVAPGDRYTGGDIVLAAEQWPRCTNPVTGCATLAWYRWSLSSHVLPQLMELDEDANYVPSPLLDGEPILTGAGTEDGPDDEPFTITFNLNPDAVWDDGTPITSTDIRFTWLARMHTTGTATTTGWEDIADVVDDDPHVAVMIFDRPTASWEVLGGGSGITSNIIKAGYFEQFEGEDVTGIIEEEDPETGEIETEELEVEGFTMEEPDISAFINDELPFSGGPFIAQSWNREELVLVPNENYWVEERMARVDSVTFVPHGDQAAAIAALRAGEIDALSPQPLAGLDDQIGDAEMAYAVSGSHEGLRPTIDSRGEGLENNPASEPEVRRAMLHAIDRQGIVDELVVPDYPEVEVNHCADWSVIPLDGFWCQEDNQLFDVEHDPGEAEDILEAAGWELDGDVRVKDGQTLTVQLSTTSGNERREDTQLRVRDDLEAVGFEVSINNEPAGQYFGSTVQNREFDVGLWAWVAGPDPNPQARFHCDAIPTEENDFAGTGFHNWCRPDVDELIDQQEELVVDEERYEVIKEIHEAMFEDTVVIPLFAMPNVTVWDPDRVEPDNAKLGTQDSSYARLYNWAFTG